MKSATQVDIAIIGAGLVGLSAALAFARQGKKIVLLDTKPPLKVIAKTWDERIYALTESTIVWLKTIGVWQYVDQDRVNGIQAMHLRNEKNEAPLVLSAEDADLMQMGCIIENQNLMQACWQALSETDVTFITEKVCKHIHNKDECVRLTLSDATEVDSQLLIAADGVNSWVRKQFNIGVHFKPFAQTAIVANFSTELSHQNAAMQLFAEHETFALLPLVGKNVSLVWSLSTDKASELLKQDDEILTNAVKLRSKNSLGEIKLISKVLSFELNQQTANSIIAERLVLMGDAAHQVHPMAGQGVNLGFRDVMKLAEMTTKTHGMQDIGEKSFLRKYERARKLDVFKMNHLTSGLDNLFATKFEPLRQLSAWGMQQLNRQPNIKKHLIHLANNE